MKKPTKIVTGKFVLKLEKLFLMKNPDRKSPYISCLSKRNFQNKLKWKLYQNIPWWFAMFWCLQVLLEYNIQFEVGESKICVISPMLCGKLETLYTFCKTQTKERNVERREEKSKKWKMQWTMFIKHNEKDCGEKSPFAFVWFCFGKFIPWFGMHFEMETLDLITNTCCWSSLSSNEVTQWNSCFFLLWNCTSIV